SLPANQRTTERGERLMDVGPPAVANAQTRELIEPPKRTLDYPPRHAEDNSAVRVTDFGQGGPIRAYRTAAFPRDHAPTKGGLHLVLGRGTRRLDLSVTSPSYRLPRALGRCRVGRLLAVRRREIRRGATRVTRGRGTRSLRVDAHAIAFRSGPERRKPRICRARSAVRGEARLNSDRDRSAFHGDR